MSNESIGQKLTRHREAMGLTTATAATRLHCDESILISLEADRFAEIGARVFAQGHLRRYADLLGAPTAELMAEWSAQGASLGAPDLTQIPRAPVRAVDSQVWVRRLGVLAAAIVIAVAAWWILRGAGLSARSGMPTETSVVDTAATETASAIGTTTVTDTTSTPVAGAPAAGTLEAGTSASSSPVTAGAPSATASVVATPASVIAAPAVVTGKVTLAIDARADCWVEIYDATGRKLYFDNLRRGSEARVSGEGPLRVLLGRADVTSLEVGGRPVTIPAELIRNLTAYFTVDAAATLRAFNKPENSAGSTP